MSTHREVLVCCCERAKDVALNCPRELDIRGAVDSRHANEKGRTKEMHFVWCLCCHVRKCFHSGGSSGASDNLGTEKCAAQRLQPRLLELDCPAVGGSAPLKGRRCSFQRDDPKKQGTRSRWIDGSQNIADMLTNLQVDKTYMKSGKMFSGLLCRIRQQSD